MGASPMAGVMHYQTVPTTGAVLSLPSGTLLPVMTAIELSLLSADSLVECAS